MINNFVVTLHPRGQILLEHAQLTQHSTSTLEVFPTIIFLLLLFS